LPVYSLKCHGISPFDFNVTAHGVLFKGICNLTYKLKSDLYTPPFKGSPLWMGEKTAFTHRLTLKPCKIKTPAPKIRGVALPILRGSNFTTGLRSPGSGSKFPHAFPDFLQWHHVGSLPFTVARPHRNLTGFPWLPASLILQKIACN
jgi:hypothetical protein